MPVKREPSGRRAVHAEVEVPGTPEAVWQAIATGPGISAWFVPSEVEGRVGGKTLCHFGPGDSMDAVATITEWQQPRRFVARSEEQPGAVASEWTIDPKADGTCRVRIVHSWFADSDEWDSQFEGYAEGWLSFFKILRLYLARFPGQKSALVQLAAPFEGSLSAAFERLMGPLRIAPGMAGQAVTSGGEAPALGGRVHEALVTPEGFSVILELETPGQGIAHMIGFPLGGPIHISLRFYLYGNEATAKAGEIERLWQEWLAARFPAANPD